MRSAQRSSLGVFVAWSLTTWLAAFYLIVVPEPVLGKLLTCAALALSIVGSRVLHRAQRVFVLFVGIALLFAFGKYLTRPAAWVLVLAFVLLSYFGAIIGGERWRLVLINLGAVFLAVAFAEIYLSAVLPFVTPGLQQSFSVSTEAGKSAQGNSTPDVDLGFRNMAKAKITETKTWNGGPLYRVTYSTNEWGWRSIPIVASTAARPVLFLGCSVVFGQGVEDAEAMPAAFQRASNGEFRSYNLSAPGYGAHQALRILERELEREALPNEAPAAAIYVALSDQVPRSAGLRFWDQRGPRYVVNQEGKASYDGRLDDGLVGAARSIVLKSELGRRLSAYATGTAAQEQLYVAIIRQAAEVFVQRYKAPFYVLYWGDPATPDDAHRMARLRDAGLTVIPVSDALTDYSGAPTERYMIPHDGHPTAYAQIQVGTFLADYLSKRLQR